jgi:hypothetical protein
MPLRFPARPILLSLLTLILGVALAASALAQCTPAACSGTHGFINFESFTPGTSVEGLGAVHPDLIISSVAWPFGPACTVGSAAVIEENVSTPFDAYAAGGSVPNNCLTGIRGFGDQQGCVLDYDFTFAPGVTVNCFSIRMLDFGDLQPFGGTTHTVTLTAYDASSTVVSTDQLVMAGGVDLVTGDACTAQAGEPGNRLFTVTGPNIVKVTLRFDAFPDPNVGFDDISFCETTIPTSIDGASWGRLKTLYR